MNAIIKPEEMSPVEEFVLKVLPEYRLEELSLSLPSHIKPAMFRRNLLNAVMINPNLMGYLPGLLFREVSKAAALGLLLDPQLGEAYIVEAYNYKTRQVEPQLRIGYRGLCKLARQSGEVSLIYAHEVCERDFIEAYMGSDKQLVHKPELFTDRGPVVGYYAVIKYRDGAFDYEPMSVDQCHAIRDRSDAWKAYKEAKIKSTPWATDEDEMSKKTTIRRLMKRAPQSPELSEAIRIEDEAEGVIDTHQHRAPRIDTRRPPPGRQIEAKATETVNTLGSEEDTREPAHVEPPPQEEDRRRPPGARKPAQGEPQKLDPIAVAMQRGYEARKTSNIRRGAIPGEYRDKGREEEASAYQDGWDKADAQQRQDQGALDEAGTLSLFEKRIASVQDDEDLALAWSDIIQQVFTRMSDAGKARANELYRNKQADVQGG